MRRSLLKITIVFSFFAIFCVTANAADKKSNLFVVGDSIILGSGGANEYSDYLQKFLDRIYGSDKIAVYNYSFYDLNTRQIFRLVENLLSKQKNTEYVVIMAGEANFYNLKGFPEYLNELGRYSPQTAIIEESELDAAIKLNTGVASIYNSPLAFSQKAFVEYAFSIAYRTLAGAGPRKIGGYVPKIIPAFVLLSDVYDITPVDASFLKRYRAVWDMINDGKYKEAEETLLLLLSENPHSSNVYYALGSLYLMQEGREKEALKMFMDGILLNPFDKNNKNYKGLSIMYMSYDGEIISEILYFVRAIKMYMGESIPEINAISAINTADYDKKIAAINNWIVSDIKKIDDLTKSKGVKLIVAGYPFNAKSNELLKNSFSLSNIEFVDNSNIKTEDVIAQSQQIYPEIAKNVVNVIDRIGAKNKK